VLCQLLSPGSPDEAAGLLLTCCWRPSWVWSTQDAPGLQLLGVHEGSGGKDRVPHIDVSAATARGTPTISRPSRACWAQPRGGAPRSASMRLQA
jgi:hypothetical protein